jgi:hypothetical protein
MKKYRLYFWGKSLYPGTAKRPGLNEKVQALLLGEEPVLFF